MTAKARHSHRAGRAGVLLAAMAALTVPPALACGEAGAAWLGVALEPADGGVRVASVVPDSPADEAGLARGDRITAIDGAKVTAPDDVVDAVRRHEPGDRLTLHLRDRKGEERDVTVELGRRPRVSVFGWEGAGPWLGRFGERLQDLPRLLRRFGVTPAGGARLGVEVIEPSDALRTKLGGEPGRGVLVNRVAPDSPAEGAGIEAGDLILAVDGVAVTDPWELRHRIDKYEPGDEVRIDLLRDGRETTVRAVLEEGGDPGPRVFFWRGDGCGPTPDRRRDRGSNHEEPETPSSRGTLDAA